MCPATILVECDCVRVFFEHPLMVAESYNRTWAQVRRLRVHGPHESRDGYQYEGNVACRRLRQVAASLQSVGNLVFTGENKLFDVSTTQK